MFYLSTFCSLPEIKPFSVSELLATPSNTLYCPCPSRLHSTNDTLFVTLNPSITSKMKFSIVAAALIAVVAAHFSEEVCSGAVTVTVTE